MDHDMYLYALEFARYMRQLTDPLDPGYCAHSRRRTETSVHTTE